MRSRELRPKYMISLAKRPGSLTQTKNASHGSLSRPPPNVRELKKSLAFAD
jgi:hypothetical protein